MLANPDSWWSSTVRPATCSKLKLWGRKLTKTSFRDAAWPSVNVGQTVRSKQKEIWLNIWPPTSLSTPAVWVLGTHLTDLASDYSRGLASQVDPVCSRVRTSVSKPGKQNQSNLHGGNRLPLRVTGRRRQRTEVKDSLLGQSGSRRRLQSEDSACVRFRTLTDVEAKAAKLDSVQLASHWEILTARQRFLILEDRHNLQKKLLGMKIHDGCSFHTFRRI